MATISHTPAPPAPHPFTLKYPSYPPGVTLTMMIFLDSMIVYVIIGVVGFAAGAGGILWAVCMFIRRWVDLVE